MKGRGGGGGEGCKTTTTTLDWAIQRTNTLGEWVDTKHTKLFPLLCYTLINLLFF